METLNEVLRHPSGFDSLDNYIGQTDFPDLLVVLCQNRDSDRLTRSNFQSALDQLGGENENVIIHRFNHWACGWWEALCIIENTESSNIAKRIQVDIENYPVLNEDHYYDLQYNESVYYWENLDLREKIELCRKYDISIFSARTDYIPENDGSLDEYLESE